MQFEFEWHLSAARTIDVTDWLRVHNSSDSSDTAATVRRTIDTGDASAPTTIPLRYTTNQHFSPYFDLWTALPSQALSCALPPEPGAIFKRSYKRNEFSTRSLWCCVTHVCSCKCNRSKPYQCRHPYTWLYDLNAIGCTPWIDGKLNTFLFIFFFWNLPQLFCFLWANTYYICPEN